MDHLVIFRFESKTFRTYPGYLEESPRIIYKVNNTE